MRALPTHRPAGRARATGRARLGGARRERRRGDSRARAPDPANAPGRVEYRARPDATEEPRGPAGASHGAIARRRARRKFQTDGPAARLHPGWRGNHALGLGQYFPEEPGGAAGERHTDLAGTQPLPAAFDDPLALPAILLRAAEHRAARGDSEAAHPAQALRAKARRAVGRG